MIFEPLRNLKVVSLSLQLLSVGVLWRLWRTEGLVSGSQVSLVCSDTLTTLALMAVLVTSLLLFIQSSLSLFS